MAAAALQRGAGLSQAIVPPNKLWAKEVRMSPVFHLSAREVGPTAVGTTLWALLPGGPRCTPVVAAGEEEPPVPRHFGLGAAHVAWQ